MENKNIPRRTMTFYGERVLMALYMDFNGEPWPSMENGVRMVLMAN